MNRVYKYLLKPTVLQKTEIDNVLDLCRIFYNSIKELDLLHQKNYGRYISKRFVEHQIKDVKSDIKDYDKIHTHLLKSTLERYFKTRSKSYLNYKRTGKFTFPRWKSRENFNTISFVEYNNGCKILKNNKIKFNH
ncbi:MAG: helix-turn-helix domain-containing protein, partial [Bacteroidales bacterium]